MNNQEAKLILETYRLGGHDAEDPQFQEALEQLKRDPELARWFAEERSVQTRIQTKLRTALKPPAHLKASLLAQGKIVRPAIWWRRPAWMTAAAALVILAALAAYWIKPSNEFQFTAFRQAMVQNSIQMTDHVSLMTQDVNKIRQWLKEQAVDANFTLPNGLRNKPTHGCRVVDWKGQKVILLCFMLSGGEHLDLFVIDRTPFRDFVPSATPQFARADGLMTATWTKGEKTYLLTSTANETLFRKLL